MRLKVFVKCFFLENLSTLYNCIIKKSPVLKDVKMLKNQIDGGVE